MPSKTEFLLVIFYWAIFSLICLKAKFMAVDGLKKRWVVFMLAVKVIGGIMYGYIHNKYYWGGDAQLFFDIGKIIHESIPKAPMYYLKGFLLIPEGLPPDPNTMWVYPDSFEMVKLLGWYSLIHLHVLLMYISGGYYNVHVIFIAFVSLMAGLNFYKVFKRIGTIHETNVGLLVFFIPSVAFWCSGMHKDTFVYLGLSVVMLSMTRLIESNKIQNWATLIFGVLIIFTYRHYLLTVLFVPLTGWILYYTKFFNKIWKSYLAATCLFIGLFWALALISDRANIVNVLYNSRQEFLALLGGSKFYVAPLEPNLWDFVRYAPMALFNMVMRPLPYEIKTGLQFLAFLEFCLLVFLFVLSLIFSKNGASIGKRQSFYWFAWTYAFFNYLLIGVLMDNSGTIVRYRSVALGLVFWLVIERIDVAELKKYLGLK